MKNRCFYFLLILTFLSSCEETSLEPLDVPETSYDISVMQFLADPGQVIFFNETFASDDYALFIQALERTGLDASAVSGQNNTIFAPGSVTMQRILDSDDSWNTIDDIPLDVLTEILETHILSGRFLREDFRLAPGSYETLAGNSINVAITNIGDTGRGLNIRVGAALVQTADLQFTDGVVHTYGTARTRANNSESQPLGL